MAIEILMPALSPTMEEGTLAKWLVKEGDTVSSGDLLAEIETDKATMEFEAVDEGVIGKLIIAEGTEGVKVNSPIALLLEEGESADDDKVRDPVKSTAKETSSETTETSAEMTEPQKGYGSEPGGADLARKEMSSEASTGDRIFATPLARRIAKDRGLDLHAISGSGPHGRIVKADVEHAERGEAPKPVSVPAQEGAAKPQSVPSKGAMPTGPSADQVMKMYEGRAYEEIKLDGMRKTVAARLTEAKQTIPHFYLRRDMRLDALLSFRSQLNKQLEPRGIKLSVNDFIIKACAVALQQVPDANAVWAGDRILKMEASDVAVAVAIEGGGLFTPVLRDAEMKSLSALSTEMKDLAARARDRKLGPQEYQGGSFAISNLGMFGIDNFDAVINPPHGAILAVGAGVKKPVVGSDGEITAATVMSVTLSVDHRVIDGALGASLLNAIAANLENPITMLA